MSAARKVDRRSAEGVARADRLIATLAVTVFFEWMGAGAFLPLFPIYLQRHGSSSTMVGITMAAFFLAGIVTQYPAGRLADHWGRREVLMAGQGIYAITTLGFLFTTAPAAMVALRFLQGVGAGAAEVAALSVIGAVVAPERRGRAFGTIYAAQLTGTIIGPLVGAAFGVQHMELLFIVTALVCGAAAIPVLLRPELDAHGLTTAVQEATPWRLPRAAAGALLVAAALGLIIGVYDAVWSLLLRNRGAGDVAINLSWVLFSLPFALTSRPAGRLADRLDRRRLAIGAVLVDCAFCTTYPFVRSVPVLLVLGALEATVIALALPSAQSLLTEHVAEAHQGRVQGLYATSQTAATALSAGLAGVLFARASWLPFVAMAAAAGCCALAMIPIWSSVAGHVRHGDGASEPAPIPGSS